MWKYFALAAAAPLLFLARSPRKTLPEQVTAAFSSHLGRLDSTATLDSVHILWSTPVTEKLSRIIDDTVYMREYSRIKAQLSGAMQKSDKDSLAFYRYEIAVMEKEIDSISKSIGQGDTTHRYGTLMACAYYLSKNNQAQSDSTLLYIDSTHTLRYTGYLDSSIAKTARLLDALSNAAQPVKTHGRLKVVGTQLMDEHNRPYALRGMSLGWSCYWPRFYNAGTVNWLYSDWNCSVIRAAMGIEPRGGYEDDPAGSKKLIGTVVNAAIQSGIYVIIDWHADHIKPEKAKIFFGEMAAKYGKYPNIIYEVFNEPAEVGWPEVKAYAEGVIKVIRQIDSNNIILVGCPRWDQELQLPAADPIKGVANLMYTMHFYAGTHRQWLRDRTDSAIRTGLPVFISESGAMNASGDGPIDYKEWQAYIDWINKNDLSWISWAVIDKKESDAALYPSAGSTGHWRQSDLTEYGVKIREYLRGYPSVSHGQFN